MGIFKDISLTLDCLNDELEDYFECYPVAYILIEEERHNHVEVAYEKGGKIEWVDPTWFDGQNFKYTIIPPDKIGDIIYAHLQASGILKQAIISDAPPIDFDKLFRYPEDENYEI